MKCSRIGCSNEATHRMKFVIALTNEPDDQMQTYLQDIFVCTDHATEETEKDMLLNNTQGREQIENGFGDAGLPRPDWDRSFAKWEPMN